jgi:5-methyltetrahydrofolate--homocysteine methyltransferase
MRFKRNWDETRKRFGAWWKNGNTGRPLLHLVGLRETSSPRAPADPGLRGSPEDQYLDTERIVGDYLSWCETAEFLGESYPNIGLDLGPGSLALYLGANPVFTRETVWFEECVRDWKAFGDPAFDPENRWWKTHFAMVKKAKEMVGDDVLVNVPDLVENVDILAALRGPQQFCFDLIDEPELVKRLVSGIDGLYFRYFDAFHDLVADSDGVQGFAAFRICGEGRTAKIQCDFSALMSPRQFDDFVVPSLARQCANLDHSMYHLDGPDALKHADSVLTIPDLDVLQWSPGAGQPDGDSEKWFPLYDKAKKAGKGLWVGIGETDPLRLADRIDAVVQRVGTSGLFLFLPDLPLADAEKTLSIVEKRCGA